jgi:phenylalanyl-tRNA synthetase alpha chain
MLDEKIAELRVQSTTELAKVRSAEELAQLKNRFLTGKTALLRELYGLVAKLPADQKGAGGQKVNAFKTELEAAITSKTFGGAKVETFEDSLPGAALVPGRRHPIYQTLDEICRIFSKLGFDIEYGPEIDTEGNNFQSLNIPLDHPSRDAFDTFYIRGQYLLRSHTSPVQIRAMKRRKPPFRLIAPGKVFRPDDADASHLPSFHQVEGLMVGPEVNFAQLKGVLLLFAKEMFGEGTQVRFRPSFFPFTEPSAEVDISCFLCNAKGCPACKGSGWMEILGSGMVHPKVFEAVSYNPETVTGFAFGMGVERICMLRHGVKDIRWFVDNNFRFLKQF